MIFLFEGIVTLWITSAVVFALLIWLAQEDPDEIGK